MVFHTGLVWQVSLLHRLSAMAKGDGASVFVSTYVLQGFS